MAGFAIHIDSECAGYAHFDLYARPGKITRARCVSLQQRNGAPQSLVALSLPPRDVTHSQVVTLLHECGHLAQSILRDSRSPEGPEPRGAVSDFVEVMPQVFEQAAWDHRFLERMGAVSGFKVDRMQRLRQLPALRDLARNSRLRGRLMYARLGFELHGLEHPASLTDIRYIARSIGQKFDPLGLPEQAHLHWSFPHLAVYGPLTHIHLWGEQLSMHLFDALQGEHAVQGYRQLLTAATQDEVSRSLTKTLPTLALRSLF